jgi:hypothetical protein
MPSILHGSMAILLIGVLGHADCSAQAARQVSITGDWYFDRFGGPHGEIAHSPEIVKANKHEAGYQFTLTKDGKFITTQPNGTQNTMDYQYIARRREVILGKDTMKVMLLTSKILELYPIKGKQPALFLKRTKDGKTSMSAAQ